MSSLLTSLKHARLADPRVLYEALYCAWAEAENRVGEQFELFADASAQTIRLTLLKLGAQVRTSVRRIHFAIASAYPNKVEFELAHIYLQRAFNSARVHRRP